MIRAALILHKILNYILFIVVRIYQILISPMLPKACRFYPSCSNYAIEALKIHSFFKAIYLIIKRILKCHPGNEGGMDPVPTLSDRKKR